jgi:hypothetical protein
LVCGLALTVCREAVNPTAIGHRVFTRESGFKTGIWPFRDVFFFGFGVLPQMNRLIGILTKIKPLLITPYAPGVIIAQ